MNLPTELQNLILGYVGGNDTFKVSTLCKLWFNLLNKKFNKDDFSDKAINDSFALKHLKILFISFICHIIFFQSCSQLQK